MDGESFESVPSRVVDRDRLDLPTTIDDPLDLHRTKLLLMELGYQEAEPQADPDASGMLAGTFGEAVRRLNPSADSAVASWALNQFHAQGVGSVRAANEIAHGLMVHGASFKGYGPLRFIDFDEPDNNAFSFSHAGGGFRRSAGTLDLVAFVNGIPIARIAAGVGLPESAPHLRRIAQIVVLRDGADARCGALGAPLDTLVKWPHESCASGESRYSMAIRGLLSKRALLDLIRYYVVFEHSHSGASKKVARPSQFLAVEMALARIASARQPAARGGLVLLPHGAGRSFAMALLAFRLGGDARNSLRKVVLVSDRTRVVEETRSVFFDRTGVRPEISDTGAQFERLFASRRHVVAVVSFKKFCLSLAKGRVASRSDDVFFLFDDPSRANERVFVSCLRRYLPNACLFAFRPNPIGKRERALVGIMGPMVQGQSARDAVEQEATLPVVYERRRCLSRSRRTSPDAAEGSANGESSCIERAREIAADVLEHFGRHVAPRGFKAQLFANSRREATFYKRFLDEMSGVESALVTSDVCETRTRRDQFKLASRGRDEVLRRFRNPADPLSLIVVCDVLDFDAPIQQALYLDAAVRAENLLRAVARVNRRAPGKEHGLVLDYRGIEANLRQAVESIQQVPFSKTEGSVIWLNEALLH